MGMEAMVDPRVRQVEAKDRLSSVEVRSRIDQNIIPDRTRDISRRMRMATGKHQLGCRPRNDRRL